MCESIGKSVYNDYSTTELQSKTFIYTWKIQNLKFHVSDTNDKSWLTSKSKAIGVNGESVWSVKLNINYKYSGATNHYLCAIVTIDTDLAELNARYPNYLSLHIVKADGNEEEVSKKLNILASSRLSGQTEVVFDKFKFRNEILDENNKLLSNGDLTLKFELNGATGDLIISYSDPAVFPDLGLNNPKQSVGSENLLNNKKFSDVKIIVGDTQFFAYKGILADRSPVFAAMFEHNMKENIDSVVQVTDVDYETMHEVLRFIYAGKVNNIKSMANKLLAAADKYEIEDLKLICEKILINTLNVNTVTSLLILADKYSAKILKKFAVEFFKLHMKKIVKNENYTKDINDLLPILPDIVESLAL